MATASAQALVTLKGGVGAYKELNTSTVLLENELKGTEKFGAATYPQ